MQNKINPFDGKTELELMAMLADHALSMKQLQKEQGLIGAQIQQISEELNLRTANFQATKK
jgi:hypothetical protein